MLVELDEAQQTLAEQGIDAPFPIQTATLPDTLAGRDVLGRGRTGSGKTLAFALPRADWGQTVDLLPSAFVLALVSFIPLNQLPLAAYVRSFTDDLAISTLVLLGWVSDGAGVQAAVDLLTVGSVLISLGLAWAAWRTRFEPAAG